MSFSVKELEVFVGKGITLPLTLVNGSVPVSSGFDLLRSSIRLILSWVYGTRFMLNEFGTRLEELLEEGNDDVTLTLLENQIEDAITQWEARVVVVGVSATRDKLKIGHVNILIAYRVKGTNLEDTFIYPFYSQITK
jgi:phage baseplate assembly protein W